MAHSRVSNRAAGARRSPIVLPAGMLRVLEASPNPIVVIDTTARIRYLNPQAEVAFGYSREELLGQNIEILVPAALPARRADERDGFLAHQVARPVAQQAGEAVGRS